MIRAPKKLSLTARDNHYHVAQICHMLENSSVNPTGLSTSLLNLSPQDMNRSSWQNFMLFSKRRYLQKYTHLWILSVITTASTRQNSVRVYFDVVHNYGDRNGPMGDAGKSMDPLTAVILLWHLDWSGRWGEVFGTGLPGTSRAAMLVYWVITAQNCQKLTRNLVACTNIQDKWWSYLHCARVCRSRFRSKK
jgi:hypothetical protein